MPASEPVPPVVGGPLRSVDEKAALRPVFDPAAFASPVPPGRPGEWLLTSPMSFVDAAVLVPALAGHVGGAAHPPFRDGRLGALVGETVVCRAPDLFCAPGWGGLITPGGEVMEAAVAEARARTPDLSHLPGVRRDGVEPAFAPAANMPLHPPATVFMPYGARANWGHFLLDALPSLLAVEEAGLKLRPIAPPLTAWQRDLLALLRPGTPVVEVRAPLVRLEEAAWATTMHHFLHRPNALVDRLRTRLLAAAPPPGTVNRIYLSRRGLSQRLLVNEAALEAALIARGFLCIRPETMSALAQVALLRGARIVVGTAGAALAGALFTEPGAKIFEIQPENFASHWVRDLCRTIGAEWFGWFETSPLIMPPTTARLRWVPRALAGRYRFAWRLDLPGFLRFLDERT